LVHGAAHPQVRTPNTLAALSALERFGLLSETDATLLREGYLFHRRVENRLRLVHGNSLSAMPTEGRALSLLARRLGFFGAHPGEDFLEHYRTHTETLRQAYERLLVPIARYDGST
jgi:glutamate-ammonia-ligase adenylyltransferase